MIEIFSYFYLPFLPIIKIFDIFELCCLVSSLVVPQLDKPWEPQCESRRVCRRLLYLFIGHLNHNLRLYCHAPPALLCHQGLGQLREVPEGDSRTLKLFYPCPNPSDLKEISCALIPACKDKAAQPARPLSSAPLSPHNDKVKSLHCRLYLDSESDPAARLVDSVKILCHDAFFSQLKAFLVELLCFLQVICDKLLCKHYFLRHWPEYSLNQLPPLPERLFYEVFAVKTYYVEHIELYWKLLSYLLNVVFSLYPLAYALEGKVFPCLPVKADCL